MSSPPGADKAGALAALDSKASSGVRWPTHEDFTETTVVFTVSFRATLPCRWGARATRMKSSSLYLQFAQCARPRYAIILSRAARGASILGCRTGS